MKNILALDLGRGSLGVAISRSGMFVTPLRNLRFPMGDYEQALDLLLEAIRGEKVEAIVIGLPLFPSGDKCAMTSVVEQFIPLLQRRFPGIPVLTQDERYSTLEASAALHEVGKKAKKQHKTIDETAACVILERYLRRIGQL